MSIDIERIRNIGIAAHIDAGKTTLSEHMIYLSGRSHRIGEVDAGQTTLDWMPQERERGITITAAATSIPWKGFQINLIDTPGHVDFTAEVERSLRVVDGMLALFCAVGGVEPQSETVWRQAERYRVPRVVFVNKMDRVGADFFGVVEEIRRDLGANAVPIVLPIGCEEEFRGLVDLLGMQAILYEEDTEVGEPRRVPIPGELVAQARKAREELIERVAEHDDQLLSRYLSGGEVTQADLVQAIRHSTLSGRVVPVLCGSAAANKGVHRLLDAVVDFLPSPADLPPAQGTWEGRVMERRPDKDEPLSALVFKVQADRHVGRLCFVRVYSGVLRTGEEVLQASRGERQRIGRLCQMHGAERIPVEALEAGEVGAVVGLAATTGETLADPAHPIQLEPMEFPAPVLDLAVAPAHRVDSARFSQALSALVAEDPTLAMRADPETLETVVSGMGELHLEILVDRLTREFGVEVVTGAPQVAYRETLAQAVDYEHRLVKQTGGRGQYAHIIFRLEPTAPGTGLEFESRVVSGRVPKEFIPAIRKGVAEAMARGPGAGYPVVNVRFILLDGSFHEVDSSEQAFRTCTVQGFREAMRRAGVVFLEPVGLAEVTVPEDQVGPVMGSLAARRGRVLGVEVKGGTALVSARVPLSEMFGYASTLRNLTSGRGSFLLRFERYEAVPEDLVPQVASRQLPLVTSRL